MSWDSPSCTHTEQEETCQGVRSGATDPGLPVSLASPLDPDSQPWGRKTAHFMSSGHGSPRTSHAPRQDCVWGQAMNLFFNHRDFCRPFSVRQGSLTLNSGGAPTVEAPPRERRLTWHHSEAAERGTELSRQRSDVRGGCGRVMQLPAGLASLQAGPGPGSQASATCRCEAERAGGGVEAGTPCPLAPGSSHDDGGTGRAPSGEPAETVPGWVVSRGGRWQLLGSGRKEMEARKRQKGREASRGRGRKERQAKTGTSGVACG